jgi:AbrB family looped-hinge helix DNA binding protein
MREASGSGPGQRDERDTPSSGAPRMVSGGLPRGERMFMSIGGRLVEIKPTAKRRKERGYTSYSIPVDPPLKVTVGKSGRVTLPASVREELNLDEGTELNVQVEAGELVLTPVVTVPRSYHWAYSPEHLDRLDSALADADEGRIGPLDEGELTQVLRV